MNKYYKYSKSFLQIWYFAIAISFANEIINFVSLFTAKIVTDLQKVTLVVWCIIPIMAIIAVVRFRKKPGICINKDGIKYMHGLFGDKLIPFTQIGNADSENGTLIIRNNNNAIITKFKEKYYANGENIINDIKVLIYKQVAQQGDAPEPASGDLLA